MNDDFGDYDDWKTREPEDTTSADEQEDQLAHEADESARVAIREDGAGDPGLHTRAIHGDDPTEVIRRFLVEDINATPHDRAALLQRYDTVWDTAELASEFEVQGFLAPFATVRRRADGVLGSVCFQHAPRFYFGFRPAVTP